MRTAVFGSYLALRDRLTANPGFRRWAARFPLTRWIARRHARALFDLNAGFVYSQILQSCVSLGVFDHLRDGPLSLATLALRLQLPEPACQVLLDAASTLDLCERRAKARYGLGPLGAALLDNSAVISMVQHHALFYRDLQDLPGLLQGSRRGAVADYWSYAGSAPGEYPADTLRAAEYSRLMSQSQSLVAEQVLDAYDFSRHRRLLDVGGGEGAFVRAVLQRHRSLQGSVFDLPAVSARAAVTLQAAGLAGRVDCCAGDFRCDPLPPGADLISLVRVLHDHDDPVVEALLAAVYAALPPGGTLLVIEPLAETPGAERMGYAYFGLYFLAMGSGAPRSAARLTQLLGAAGFVRIRRCPTSIPLQTSMLVAHRPARDSASVTGRQMDQMSI